MSKLIRFTDSEGIEQFMEVVGTEMITLSSGEDQDNDVLKVETQHGYETFDRTGGSDVVLGTTGAAGDLLSKILVKETVLASAINIYDGTVAGGTLFFTIPISTPAGTVYYFDTMCTTNWTIEDDTNNAGQLTCIGRFT